MHDSSPSRMSARDTRMCKHYTGISRFSFLNQKFSGFLYGTPVICASFLDTNALRRTSRPGRNGTTNGCLGSAPPQPLLAYSRSRPEIKSSTAPEFSCRMLQASLHLILEHQLGIIFCNSLISVRHS